MRFYEKPLQLDQPLFVRIPFDARGKSWKQGDHFPWKEMSIDENKVYILYRERYLIHNEQAEAEQLLGDGLETMDLEMLQNLVADYNKRIKLYTQNSLDFDRRKVKLSANRDKQIALIRTWKRTYETWLIKAEKASEKV